MFVHKARHIIFSLLLNERIFPFNSIKATLVRDFCPLFFSLHLSSPHLKISDSCNVVYPKKCFLSDPDTAFALFGIRYALKNILNFTFLSSDSDLALFRIQYALKKKGMVQQE